MPHPPPRPAPAAYRLRIDGHLDPHWSPWFGDLVLTHEDDGTTCLTAAVTDQAQLHGLLAKIRDLGVTLISVDAVDGVTTERAAPKTPETSGTADNPAAGRDPEHVLNATGPRELAPGCATRSATA
jgi:hypothetical protein